MNSIEFDELPEFRKDLKQLLKKYRTLREDLEVVKLDLNDEPGESPPFSFRIDHLRYQSEENGLQSIKRPRSKFRIAFNLCPFSRRPKNHVYRTVP